MANNGYEYELMAQKVLSSKFDTEFTIVGDAGNKEDLIAKGYSVSVKGYLGEGNGANQVTRIWPENFCKQIGLSNKVCTILEEFSFKVTNGYRIGMDEISEKDFRLIQEELTYKLPTIMNFIFNKGNKVNFIAICNKKLNKVCFIPYDTFIEYVMRSGVSKGVSIRGRKTGLKLGAISLQRKGGDSGAMSADQIQFKFSPGKAFTYFKNKYII